MNQIKFKEGIHLRLCDFAGLHNLVFNQESVELAAFPQNFRRRMDGISAILEVGGEAVEIGADGAASEIDQGSFFFVPVFEHRLKGVFLLKTRWSNGTTHSVDGKFQKTPATTQFIPTHNLAS